MLVLASTAVTVVIIVAAVVVIGAVFLLFGPLRRGESLRDDVEADMGPLGTGPRLTDPTREEIRREEGLTPEFDEEKLDRENE
jgi:hypothetical protein